MANLKWGKDYTEWVYNGIPDPEKSLVERLTEDMGRFRRTAKVVYRCRARNCLLGFAYPILAVPPWEPVPEFGALDSAGRLLVRFPREFKVMDSGSIVPERGEPFSPWLWSFRTQWWMFTYRHIEPEIEFYGDPANPFDSVGWLPVTNMRECRIGSAEQLNRIGEVVEPEDLNITGKRNVWRVTDQFEFRYRHEHPPYLVAGYPPGYMNCKHTECVLEYPTVVEDMSVYSHKKPLLLPRE